MADIDTIYYGWVKPENGASADTWGDKWNGNLDGIDASLKNVENKVDNDALLKAGNLAGLENTGTARSNLGLGAAALLNAAGGFSTVATLNAAVNGDLVSFTGTGGGVQASGIATANVLTKSGNLSGLADQATARANLGMRIGAVAVFVQSGDPGGAAQDGDIWVW